MFTLFNRGVKQSIYVLFLKKRYIFKYLKDGEEKKKLQDLIEDTNTKEIKIEYKPYDFGINLKNKA